MEPSAPVDLRTRPITVLIVAYGSEEHLGACLEALGDFWPVLVIDNGQSKLTRELCVLRGAEYLNPGRNVGFAAAVNMGLRRRTPASDVLLLNPDARIAGAEVVVLRERLLEHTDVGAISPLLVNADGSSQKVLWPMPSPWGAVAGIFGGTERLSRRAFVSGAILMLRSEAVEQVGLFDERFFLYAEEADWQMRALRKGWRVTVVQEVRAIHASGGTSTDPGLRELLFDASSEALIRKWYGTAGWQMFRLASILAALRRRILSKDQVARAISRRSMDHYLKGPIRSLNERQSKT